MPTYEYECTVCGHEFEKFQSMSDEPEKTCPKCGGPVRRRIGTGAGIIFKGRGFYTTDYRSKEYRDKAKSDSGSSSSSSGSPSSPATPAADSPSASSSPPAKPGDAGAAGGSSSKE